MSYGDAPVAIGQFPLEWHEMMHWLYLPVRMPDHAPPQLRIPRTLYHLAPLVTAAIHDARDFAGFRDPYVYVTARRGYATPDNPLNRPGWHCDGFGTDDLNYVWWDRWPSRFAIGDFGPISVDHVESMRQFAERIGVEPTSDDMPSETLYRLTPHVVHATPVLAEGGMRSFAKISVSDHRYNLEGNSHNHDFHYQWQMHPRGEARNDPIYGEADYIPEPLGVEAAGAGGAIARAREYETPADLPPIPQLGGAIGRAASVMCKQGAHDLCYGGDCHCRCHE